MAAPVRNEGIELPPEILTEIARLYESGLYVQACTMAGPFGPATHWRGTAARILGGRLANNVHAPRLGRWLHGRAWRLDRSSPEAAYYYSGVLRHWHGPLAAWKFLSRLPAFSEAAPERRADLLIQQAGNLAAFRDFDSATRLLAEAEKIGADRPWFWVERGALFEQQDAYEKALAASRQALSLQSWFRPAVQSSAHQLQLLGRDEEALELLTTALDHVESTAVATQLAVLQAELKQHAAALQTWERVRALAPWMEPKVVEWWEARMSDAHYFVGNLPAAAEAAERSKNHFHATLVPRLRSPAPDARRVLLPVGFVRQHHFTCAPATLSALSRFWNMPVDHLALAEVICYDGTPDHIERHWAKENGWHAREFRVTWEVLTALLDRGIPFTLTTVETQSAHLQAVIGYDSFRGTVLIRDPYERMHGEWLGTEFLERYAHCGPRGMLLLPPEELSRLEGLELPDAALYDDHYALQRALHVHQREVAQRHLEALETASPEHRLTLHARRSVAAYDGSLPRQLAAVEGLLALHPSNGNFLWGKLVLLREMGHRGEFQDFLREICAGKEVEPLFSREWAIELATDGRRRNDAELLLRRVLRQRPTDPDNLHARANLHWDRREFAEATELYRLAANLRDKVDHYSRSYFIAARHQRQTEAALTLVTHRFEKFSALSCQSTRMLFWALSALDRQTEAFAKLELALSQRPEDGELLLFAADAFARHGEEARGAALLHSAEKRSPRIAWLRTAASIADYRCDLSNALALWREILTEEPLSMDAQRAVARLLAETQGRAVALAHLEEACTRFSHHIALHELWAEWARTDNVAAVEPIVRKLLALHPEHAWAQRELAIVCSALHRPEEAFAALAIAEELEPSSTVTAGIRAHVARDAGRLEEAREHARTALRLSVDNDSAIRALLSASPSFEEKKSAIAFIRDELVRQVVYGDGLLAYRSAAYEVVDPPELLTSLREVLTARPDLWHAWSAVVLQLVDMQQHEEALVRARQATERFPLLPRLWVDLAQVHRARGEREQEIPPLQRALQVSPAWGVASRQLADVHQRMGQYQETVRVLERAIAAAPLDPYNHGCLADALHHLHRDKEAAARLEHALKLEPGYDWAWDVLRSWSPEKGKKNRALALAHELTRLRAGEARSWYILALSLGDAPLEERLAALDRTVALNPRFVDAYDLRAQFLTDAGRFEEALAACAPAAFGAQTPTALRGRAAWIEAAQGRIRVAIGRMRPLVEGEPDYYWGWNMLAEWHLTDRNFAAAEKAARAMIRLAPRSPIPLGYLADVQMQSGDAPGAYESLRRAFEMDPNYTFAGFTLFDRHLEKNDFAEAGRVLGILITHHAGPRTQVCQIRLDGRLHRREAALATLRELTRAPESDSWALQKAVQAMVAGAWGREAESLFLEVLDEPNVNPEVGDIWVRRFAARGAWEQRQRLYQLDPESDIGRKARTAYLEEVAAAKQLPLLKELLKREEKVLRADGGLWGTVGYAYVHMGRWGDAVSWMKDIEERTDLRPWMLHNLATALREDQRDAQALAYNRRALTLQRDGTTPQHELWVAIEAGIAGDLSALQGHLPEIRENEHSNTEQTLFKLANALRAVLTAPPESRKGIFKRELGEIAHLRSTGAFHDATLERTRKRCLKALSRASGDPWGWARPWMPGSGSSRTPSAHPSPTAGFPYARIALFLVFLLPALARTCDSQSRAPYRPLTPPPSRQVKPQRPLGDTELNLRVLPPNITPAPMLPTPQPFLPPKPRELN